jgi:signal transduction histidine kinase
MGRIKRVIHDLSLRKSFVLYMLMFLLLAAGLSSVTINLAGYVRNQVNLSYQDTENQYTLSSSRGNITVFLSDAEYTQKDKTVINICTYIEIWSIPFFFGLCIISSSLLFYRNKLKKPIELLGEASEKIASNDLDFHISYDSKDEMGQLCASFETMRGALEESSRAVWRTIEERKRLNAAFSHDLRNPLTVLRGYADFLKNYLPQGKVNEEKLMSTVSTMSVHIARLENYVRTMNEVQKLEDIAAEPQEIETRILLEQLQTDAEMLVKDSGIKLAFVNDVKEPVLNLDESFVTRVWENLIENAKRYAKSRITVRYQYSAGEFRIIISDDGNGFSDEDLEHVTKPYYRNKAESGEMHFGLGLYICRVLCEKHGGSIFTGNGENGGAKVTASFRQTEKNSILIEN